MPFLRLEQDLEPPHVIVVLQELVSDALQRVSLRILSRLIKELICCLLPSSINILATVFTAGGKALLHGVKCTRTSATGVRAEGRLSVYVTDAHANVFQSWQLMDLPCKYFRHQYVYLLYVTCMSKTWFPTFPYKLLSMKEGGCASGQGH